MTLSACPIWYESAGTLASHHPFPWKRISTLSMRTRACASKISSQDCVTIGELVIHPQNSSFAFACCEKKDPDVSEEMEKNFVDLLSEELKLQEATALENQQRSDIALLEAKKLASQYQKEADKCNSGMETCEEAREKAEATLVAQKKLTELWEQRARQKGWKDEMVKS